MAGSNAELGDADDGGAVDAATGASGSGDSGPGETEAGGRPCPQCAQPMYHRHCKYVCPTHGVVFDCADTFY